MISKLTDKLNNFKNTFTASVQGMLYHDTSNQSWQNVISSGTNQFTSNNTSWLTGTTGSANYITTPLFTTGGTTTWLSQMPTQFVSINIPFGSLFLSTTESVFIETMRNLNTSILVSKDKIENIEYIIKPANVLDLVYKLCAGRSVAGAITFEDDDICLYTRSPNSITESKLVINFSEQELKRYYSEVDNGENKIPVVINPTISGMVLPQGFVKP